jgi:enediyne polyketide synthase
VSDGIAIVGMACRYPDARSPAELWETALAQRRAFRRIPAERLRLEDYREEVPGKPDSIYLEEAAVLAGWEFDRVRFRVAGATFRVADLTHWLALEVAAEALADGGFEDGGGLPRETTGVLVGNTLTGEFSRAQLLRLRWPYVRRVLVAGLGAEGWSGDRAVELVDRLEASFKAPFPEPSEESLAGGLSNTIAGRICNHFDLQGGGFTVDGACASSLLAVAQACSALGAGDLDVALAGGVDLSLDPFELVGFARTGALAAGEMRVYDAHATGFKPGEGCGFVVLMREREAVAQGRRVHAVIRGWGISADGHGGISRPEAAGQRLALARAYRRAGFGIETIGYFEGHGTGTAVGDATELAALSAALREARRDGTSAAGPAAIGTIKANIGHTKAAAGVAGLLKATLALASQTLPPTTGCSEPHAELAGESAVLRALAAPERWPGDRPLRAAVSAMGFGGVNAHLVVEGTATLRRGIPSAAERLLWAPPQDAELILLAGEDREELARQARHLAEVAPRLARAELGDLAAALHARLGASAGTGTAPPPARAAIVAATPGELATRLGRLLDWLESGTTRRLEARLGVFLGVPAAAAGAGPAVPAGPAAVLRPPRIGLLFTGQGSPTYTGTALAAAALRRRFEDLERIYQLAGLDLAAAGPAAPGATSADTAVAQPAILAHSLAGLWLLERLGVSGSVALGHSLGEIAALCWAGGCGAEAALRLAAARGGAMADHGEAGAMASLDAPAAVAGELLEGTGATVAAFNGPAHTVVSGAEDDVATVLARAAACGIAAHRLRVARAFHSPRVAAAAAELGRALAPIAWSALRRPVASTVSGTLLAPDADLAALLLAQVTAPVRFSEAMAAARPLADLWIEVGPGHALAELAAEVLGEPVLALDVGASSLGAPLGVAAALFAAGVPIDREVLFAGRFHRPFDLERPLRFLANPCESAPEIAGGRAVEAPAAAAQAGPSAAPPAEPAAAATGEAAAGERPLAVVRALVAARAELPESAVGDESRLLADLHLNSISVGQLVVEASRRLGLTPPASPTDYAQATVAQVAAALAERTSRGQHGGAETAWPAGVDAWVRAFTVELVERPLAAGRGAGRGARLGAGPGAARGGAAGDVPGPGEPSGAGSGGWQVLAPAAHPLAGPVAAALGSALPAPAAPAILLCLPAELADAGGLADGSAEAAAVLELFVAAARAAALAPAAGCLVVVQHRGGGGGFARSLRLELPAVHVWLLDLPEDVEPAQAASWVAAEVAAGWPGAAPAPAAGTATGTERGAWVEAHYDRAGLRRVPVLRLRPAAGPATAAGPAAGNGNGAGGGAAAAALGGLGPGDVLLATGGGKGIGAECALGIARTSGARLAILGRSDPAADGELAANLARLAAAGVQVLYVRADLGEPGQLGAALDRVAAELGPVTALLHAAGVNEPRRLAELDLDGLRHALAAKVHGAGHLLDLLADPRRGRLRLVVAFGSIIARTGLPGEAAYALANEWLARGLERFAASRPGCRCLVLDWSVWSGVGMGERLGTMEALRGQGIVPIPLDTGVEALLALLADPAARGGLVVTGRFGSPPTLEVERHQLPLLRFLERPRVFYPGVELVADTEISAATDPYLADHVFSGEPLFAAVVGLEAMAQAAVAVTGSRELPVFERLELLHPIAVAPERSTTLRLAALAREPGLVEVALRDSSTAFATDHFRVLCRFAARGAASPAGGGDASLEPRPYATPPRLALDPAVDLYGGILFQAGRFRRVAGYRELCATACVAEIVPDGSVGWFGRYLPPTLLLGDPAVRDAAIHGIQACIPHAQLLPTGVERISTRHLGSDESLLVAARERRRDGETFVYDLDILAADGTLRERWQGLRLRAVAPTRLPASWSAPLLAPYVERRLEELLPHAGLRVALAAGPPGGDAAAGASAAEGGGRPGSEPVLARLLAPGPAGGAAILAHRLDGRPEVVGLPQVSIAHAGRDLVLAVAGPGRDRRVGCDLEPVGERSAADWRGLLGDERFALAGLIASQRGDSWACAATRVWGAAEALRKAGAAADTPLLLDAALDDGWLVLRAGELRVATYSASLRELGGAFVLAVAAPAAAAAAPGSSPLPSEGSAARPGETGSSVLRAAGE